MEFSHLNRLIDCPLDWCVGYAHDHGGLGDPPDQWLHSDGSGVVVAGGATLCRSQVGAGPSRWVLAVGALDMLSGESVADVASQLRRMATSLDVPVSQ
ncbi:hypothetical protein [uncultured Microbacterium sp.]|uniref:Uncharacterized protein n=1 Tax=uncultured Microbacterium sp. TaxID=191216 RepID=A0A1Y5NWE4_9MICO|nr:hypothetical protein [uncultured Microbacterium sp.]SBS70777.1 hypothetical protein MIPYR_10645 [uncultured Microbacterium sp.]